ncbi:DUF3618 domain-containing protein [Methylocaldum sp. MU1018]
MATTYDETRKSEQIESDIERTRSQMAETLDTIQKRFSPGQLLDQTLNYLDENADREQLVESVRRFGVNAKSVVKENPIPVTLLGIGLAWLAVSGRSGGTGFRAGRRMSSRHATSASRGMESLHSRHGEIERSGMHAAGERLEHAKSAVSETVGHVRERMGETASHVRHSVEDTVSSVREKAGEATHRAQDRAARLGRTLQGQYRSLIEEQPLVLGALGIAVGAALGATMPRTRMEDEMMGEASDRLLHQVRETGREIMHEGAIETERRPTAERGPIAAGSISGEIRHDLGSGEAAAAAGSPMGERRGSIGDRRKGVLAETIGAATRIPPADERRRGMGDRRRSGSISRGAGYDSPGTP